MMMIIINMYTWNLLRVNPKCPHHTKRNKKWIMWGDKCKNELYCGNHFKGICLSNHHVVHLKHIQFLFVNYTSIKLEKYTRVQLFSTLYKSYTLTIMSETSLWFSFSYCSFQVFVFFVCLFFASSSYFEAFHVFMLWNILCIKTVSVPCVCPLDQTYTSFINWV